MDAGCAGSGGVASRESSAGDSGAASDTEAWLAAGYSLFLSHSALAFERDFLLPMVWCREGDICGFFPKPATHANYCAALRSALLEVNLPLDEVLSLLRPVNAHAEWVDGLRDKLHQWRVLPRGGGNNLLTEN